MLDKKIFFFIKVFSNSFGALVDLNILKYIFIFVFLQKELLLF